MLHKITLLLKLSAGHIGRHDSGCAGDPQRGDQEVGRVLALAAGGGRRRAVAQPHQDAASTHA